MADPSAPPPDDIWSYIGTMRWQHVVLIVVGLACLTAVLVTTPACTVRLTSTPTTTTTEAPHGR